MPTQSRYAATVERVFERMKAAYLHEVEVVQADNAPKEHELFEEYQEAMQSDDPQAISNLIALRGQESFDRQIAKGISQTRRQMRARGVT